MTKPRDDATRIQKARSLDNDGLRQLRVAFESATHSLSASLAVINAYLASGAPSAIPKLVSIAFLNAPDRMNECRSLIGQIEAITRDAERSVPRRHGG